MLSIPKNRDWVLKLEGLRVIEGASQLRIVIGGKEFPETHGARDTNGGSPDAQVPKA